MQSYMHMRCQAQQLDSYSSARHCSTARQLDSYLTDLDRPRQHSTPSLMESGRVRLDRLDSNSTVTRQARQARPRQRLDSASTVPRRSLDSSTARQPGLKICIACGGPKSGFHYTGDFCYTYCEEVVRKWTRSAHEAFVAKRVIQHPSSSMEQ